MKPNLPQEPPPPRHGDRGPKGETRYMDWQGIQPLSVADKQRTFYHEDIWLRRFHDVFKAPDEQDRIQKGQIRFVCSLAIETGAIDGLYHLVPEVEEALLHDGFGTARRRPLNQERMGGSLDDAIVALVESTVPWEVLNDHLDAHTLVLEHAVEDRPITKHAMRELHALITAHQETHDAVDSLGQQGSRKLEQGTFRKFEAYANDVSPQSDGAVHTYAPPEQVEYQLDRMLDLYEEYRETHHPLLVGAWLHHRFIQIHPFADGNGRTGRMVLNWHLWRTRWHPVSVHRKNRDRYLDALNRADSGDLSALVDFLIYLSRETIRTVMHEFSFEERQRVLGSV